MKMERFLTKYKQILSIVGLTNNHFFLTFRQEYREQPVSSSNVDTDGLSAGAYPQHRLSGLEMTDQMKRSQSDAVARDDVQSPVLLQHYRSSSNGSNVFAHQATHSRNSSVDKRYRHYFYFFNLILFWTNVFKFCLLLKYLLRNLVNFYLGLMIMWLLSKVEYSARLTCWSSDVFSWNQLRPLNFDFIAISKFLTTTFSVQFSGAPWYTQENLLVRPMETQPVRILTWPTCKALSSLEVTR